MPCDASYSGFPSGSQTAGRTAWRETQNGWTISIAEGVSANIQITRKGGVRWNMLLSGAADTIAEAQKRLKELAIMIKDGGGMAA